MTNQYGLWTEEKREKGEVQRMSGATKAEDMQGGQVNQTYCAALSFKSPQSQTSTLDLELHIKRGSKQQGVQHHASGYDLVCV